MKRADTGMAFMLQYENIAWYEKGKVRILDRRIYPIETRFVECAHHTEVAAAIKGMVTQSMGPYFAAAMGMVQAAHEAKDMPADTLLPYMEKAAYTLSHARPTTVENMMRVVEGALAAAKRQTENGLAGEALVDAVMDYTLSYYNSVYETADKTGRFLAEKIPHNGTIMTQCFAETVLGPLFLALRENGSAVKVICPETRPYFQGSRLTASVACDMGFDTTVVSDNMPGYVMHEKKVDVFTSAADVITMDGHVINKVGTFQIALAASYWGIPYYATGNPNPAHPGIDSVKIEERDPALVLESMGKKLTMDGVKGFYPAFDITPPKLCDGIVTDKGILSPYNLPSYFG